MSVGWWQQELAQKLQDFVEDLIAGLKPVLIIGAPPQHGKSRQIIELIAWILGRYPNLRTIYTSFSERLGVRANLALQRTFDSPRYQSLFETRIPTRNSVAISGQKLRNREILELENGDGYFRNTTVRGAITGEGLDLGIIDDPIKGREASNSSTVREHTWEWFTDDFLTRFAEAAGLLLIATRWHVDDPTGRIMDAYPNAQVLSYPALAIEDETHRQKGAALFPEHKSQEFIQLRRQMMAAGSFQSLYQQDPVIAEGELIKEAWLAYYRTLPKLHHLFITADTAMTAGAGSDYSVFQCWGLSVDRESLYLVDQIRGRWEYPDLRRQAIEFVEKHSKGPTPMRGLHIENKVSGTSLIQDLRQSTKLQVHAIKRTRASKIDRAEDVLGHIATGRVHLPEFSAFTKELVAELIQFPHGKHDDQVDPLVDAVTIAFMQKRSSMSEFTTLRASHV